MEESYWRCTLELRENRPSVWTWISIGVGAGLLVTLVAGISYHYWESQNRKKDPRAEKVKELIDEAEKLLAQGRKLNQQRQQA